jgi:RNA 2',3'-cyclic 3'-phosphodiesterase
MRLFVGIALDATATETLRGLRDRLAPRAGHDVRWQPEEGWHVTLQFLGAASEEQAACVTRALSSVQTRMVPVRITELGFFERAGIFYADVAATAELLALQQSVTAATQTCGFLSESRPYHPHVTLAKAKRRGGARALAPLMQAVKHAKSPVRAEFVAEEFLLYESFLGADGSRYEVKQRFALEAALHQGE